MSENIKGKNGTLYRTTAPKIGVVHPIKVPKISVKKSAKNAKLSCLRVGCLKKKIIKVIRPRRSKFSAAASA